MKQVSPDVDREIEHYLRTGETDPYAAAWPRSSPIDSAQRAHNDLINALLAAVQERSAEQLVRSEIREPSDLCSFTRSKTEAMIRGLFPRAEQEAVLALVERSVVFLTPSNIDATLRGCDWLGTAWDLANLYLGSLGADLLSEEACDIVGLSEHTTCFVSPVYFEESGPFADFVVHEVAHIFHNCKRQTAGLREIRGREWLLEVDFRRRETFAYACEAYATIVERARNLRDRAVCAREFSRDVRVADEQVDPVELADIVREASDRRNGWKAILARCTPARRRRSKGRLATDDTGRTQ